MSRGRRASLVVGAAVVGLVLCGAVRGRTRRLAVVVLAIGYGYDLGFKGTAWSWLPFAVGIPLLPVYGWLGAAGQLAGLLRRPAARGRRWPAPALAIANARADVERDAAAGVDSVATGSGSAGPGRSRPC